MQSISGRAALLTLLGLLLASVATLTLLGGAGEGGLDIDRPDARDIPEPIERLRTGAEPAATESSTPAPAAATPALAGAPPAPLAQPTNGRVRVAALGIDAPLIELGFDASGQLEVPHDAASVGWYTISAEPGAPGNALLGGHFDWAGELAVFYRLNALTAGDLLEVDVDGRTYAYRVTETGEVAADAPLGEILGIRSGEPTLTLFTCGGTFDVSQGEYDRRVVVRAVAVDAG